MSLSLNVAEQSFVTAVSHAPYDSLRDLVEALRALLSGSKNVLVKWSCEPDELDFELSVVARDRVAFKVRHYPDHHRLARAGRIMFSLRTSRLELCLAFWRALRDLRRHIATDEFERNWRRPFPESEMRQLTEALRSFKREAKAKTINRVA
ncbi:MAG TPA: hypothetical protein VE842_06660 [Pyrinomonadaceae bacterium]|nr:hypothetical protein [Pyrinomonadaceae bacterium]